jgi:hypothetical protein
MEDQNKFKSFGELDNSCQSMKRTSEELKRLWASGEYRLKLENITRIEKYITETESYMETIRALLDKFNKIV